VKRLVRVHDVDRTTRSELEDIARHGERRAA
jgi:hypothetical protein